MDRRFFFKHSLWAAFAAATLLLAIVMASNLPDRGALIGGGLAIILSFYYFVQQHRLAKNTLFKELFTEFNNRYDLLNNRLTEFESFQGEPTPDSSQHVVDYFNLCAEEYLFQREGYILPEVWQSWCRGMLYYIEQERFAKIWELESAKDSYYGLTTESIRDGAKSPNFEKHENRTSSAR